MNRHLSAVPRPSACARQFVVVTTADLPEAYFLLDHLMARHQAVALLHVRGRSWRDRLQVLRRLRWRHGTRYAAGLMFARLLRARYQVDDHPAFPEIDAAAIARIRSIVPVRDTSDPHSADALDFVRQQQPDYLLITGAPVPRRELYSLARHGAINRHLALSPRYRDEDCPARAPAASDADHIDYTIHRVGDRMCGGEPLLQRRVRPVPGEHFGQTLARLNRSGSEGFVEVLDALIDGRPINAER